MKLFGKTRNRNKEPTKNDSLAMLTTYQEHYFSWDGKLYQSDIVRACIRPKVKAIGKLIGKHIRYDEGNILKVNPDARLRFLLKEPNPYMTGQSRSLHGSVD